MLSSVGVGSSSPLLILSCPSLHTGWDSNYKKGYPDPNAFNGPDLDPNPAFGKVGRYCTG
jgi:hypothetical protein